MDRRSIDYEVIEPAAVLDCDGEYCLVQNRDDGHWYMGQLESDGSIVCWASNGTDLGDAIRAL